MEEERVYPKEVLIEARHKIGLYSIKELCDMFGCGRFLIDLGVNSGKLKYLSPNNRDRFIYLNDFLKFIERN